ncbi:MAG: hypothetical protein MH137_10640 [Flavobacteriales bacterium]|nr:hypothetical protein [Flavobacteriales bacterium]
MANRITAANFRKLYNNATLLNPSQANYKAGCQFEYGTRAGKKTFKIGGYFHSFLPLNETDADFLHDYFDKIAHNTPDEAQFGELDISTVADIKLNLNIPNINLNLGAMVDYTKVTKISFDEVCCRSLLHDKKAVDKMIRLLKSLENEKDFKKKLAPIMFLHDVYYAQKVHIGVERGLGAELKAKLETAGVDVGVEGNLDTKSTFTFEGNTRVPFAARVESIGDFINPLRGRK